MKIKEKSQLAEKRQYMKMLREGASDRDIFGAYCENKLKNLVWEYKHKRDDREFLTIHALKNYLLYQKIPKESITSDDYSLTVKLPNCTVTFESLIRKYLKFSGQFDAIVELYYDNYSSSSLSEFIVVADSLVPQLKSEFDEVLSDLEKKAKKTSEVIRHEGLKTAKTQDLARTTIESYAKTCLSHYGEIKFAHFKNFSHVYLYVDKKQQIDIVLDYNNLTERLRTLDDDVSQLLSLLEKSKITIRGNRVKKI